MSPETQSRKTETRAETDGEKFLGIPLVEHLKSLEKYKWVGTIPRSYLGLVLSQIPLAEKNLQSLLDWKSTEHADLMDHTKIIQKHYEDMLKRIFDTKNITKHTQLLQLITDLEITQTMIQNCARCIELSQKETTNPKEDTELEQTLVVIDAFCQNIH